MNSIKRPDDMSGRHDEDLDPDRIDQLLAALEKQLERMPPDIPATEELKLEIETLRASIESFHANAGARGEQGQAIRAAAERIMERIRGRP
jgi:hypothetical protein